MIQWYGDAYNNMVSKLRAEIEFECKDEELPGLALAVTHKDTIIFEAYHGYEDPEKIHPINCHTRFMVGSVSKVMTAHMIMHALETGAIDHLDEQVQRYLPWFEEGIKYNFVDQRAITIRQLLTHTSGLPRELPGSKHWDSGVFPIITENTWKDIPLHFRPGKEYKYSNLGYAILGLLLESFYEQPLDELLGDMFRFELTRTDWTPIGVATPYILETVKKGEDIETTWKQVAPPVANSYATALGMSSNVLDLATLVRLQTREGNLIQQPLGISTLENMRQAHAMTPEPGKLVGLGWKINQLSNEIEHGGEIGGYTSLIRLHVPTGLGIVICVNGLHNYMGNVLNTLATPLIAQFIAFMETQSNTVQYTDPTRYEGTYKHEALGLTATIRRSEKVPGGLDVSGAVNVFLRPIGDKEHTFIIEGKQFNKEEVIFLFNEGEYTARNVKFGQFDIERVEDDTTAS